MKFAGWLIYTSLLLTGCGASNSPSPVNATGEETSTKMKVLAAGASVIQDRPPIDAMSTYLDGFHFYSGELKGQMEAHHYVTVLNEDVMQAVIYDGNTSDAKLMGIEYIISERLFKTLPEEEKAYWHSHRYEVKSGSLVAPGLPEAAEKPLMSKIVNTYGKTWHTWHTDRDKTLPLGAPALMMGFTDDGQLNPRLLADRDRRFNIDSHQLRESRKTIVANPVASGADGWQNGTAIQLKRVEFKNGQQPQGHAHHSDLSAKP